MLKDRVIVSVRGERGEERGARGEGRRISYFDHITI